MVIVKHVYFLEQMKVILKWIVLNVFFCLNINLFTIELEIMANFIKA